MSGYEELWTPCDFYCPNCGKLNRGYKDKNGMIKLRCSRCRAVTVRTFMGRRHNRFDIYAPAGEQTLCVAEEPGIYNSHE